MEKALKIYDGIHYDAWLNELVVGFKETGKGRDL